MADDRQLLSVYEGLSINFESVLTLSDHSWWVALKTSEETQAGALEGKLHLPTKKATRLIIFQPGFPGGAATDFERLHVETLVDRGYAVFVARHRGIILNGEHSDYYINCAARQQKAMSDKQLVLGNGPCALQDWLVEPILSLDALGDAFEEIILIGHSFGGLAIMLSATNMFRNKLKNHEKVKKLVSLAGVGGRLRSADDYTVLRWHEFLKADWSQNRIEVVAPEQNVDGIRKAHEEVHEFAELIPESVGVICLTAWGDKADSIDELIPAQEALDMIVSVGHGTLIIDKTQKPEPGTGKLVHELENLKTDDLLKYVDPLWKPTKQILKVGTF